jgi:predicted aminopeptidase
MQAQRWFRLFLLYIWLLVLSGCSSLGYYWQAVNGHFAIMSREQPVAELLQQTDLDPMLRHKLQLAQQARQFASNKLALPDNDSFTRYADLQRPYVTWNVVATPALSVEPKQWCFIVAGCFNYLGYFHQQAAQELAKELEQQGYDVAISGAWAYSTLGWFDDPLLNTILRHDDTDVVGTIFHELAHQTVYIDDDSSFNEAFATAVEQEGLRRWFAQGGQTAAYQHYLDRREQRHAIIAMLAHIRAQLRDLYITKLSDADKRERKTELFKELKKRYQQWRSHHDYAGYDAWMQQDLNNAHLALIATYMDKVPDFLAMLASVKGDLPAFYREAKRVGDLPPVQRQAALDAYRHTS